MSEWQPIETAPKDRTVRFISYHPDWGVGIGGYTPSIGHYSRDILTPGVGPTHWQHLPEPPEQI